MWATACNVILRFGAVVVVIWDVISAVIGITVPLVSPVFVSRGSRSLRRARRFKTEVSDDPGYARREARSGYRRPRTQPSRTYGSPMPERLAESMRCSGRTPIEHYRHRWRIVAFWRAARLNLLPTTTIPKSAFTLADWRYEPIASTELAAGQPYCGGFILSVRLHRNENRQHLRRSLMTGRRRSRRLVVIASASAALTVQAATARTWRCREGQLPGEWKGGTGECLIMGDLLRRGPSLGPKQWNEYCTDSVPLAP